MATTYRSLSDTLTNQANAIDTGLDRAYASLPLASRAASNVVNQPLYIPEGAELGRLGMPDQNAEAIISQEELDRGGLEGAWAHAKNLSAAAFFGAVRSVKGFEAGYIDARTAQESHYIPVEVKEAYNRKLQSEAAVARIRSASANALREDRNSPVSQAEVINARTQEAMNEFSLSPEDQVLLNSTAEDGEAYSSKFARVEALNRDSKAVHNEIDFASKMTNRSGQQERQRVMAQYREELDQEPNDGSLGGFLSHYGRYAGKAIAETITNPAALSTDIAEMAQFLVPYAGQVALVGDATRVYSQGLNKYKQENEVGFVTDPGDHAQMLLAAAGYYALNKLGADVTRKGIGGLASAPSAVSIAERSALSNVVNTVPAGIRSIGKAAGVEGVTEGIQQQIENDWSKVSEEVDLYSVLDAAASGFVSSGALTTPSGVVNTLQDFKLRKNTVTKEQLQSSFRDNLDISNTAAYAPHVAIDKAIRLSAETEDQNEVNTLYGQAQIARDILVEDINGMESKLKTYENSAKPLEELQGDVEALTEMVNEETDPEQLEIYTNQLAETQAQLEDITLNSTPENIAKTKSTISTLKTMLGKSEESLLAFKDNIEARFSTAQEVDENGEPVEPTQPAASSTDDMFIHPMKFDPQELLTAAEDTTNTLDDNQRIALRQFAAARIALHEQKTAEDVTQDITQGSKEYRSLDTTTRLISDAMATGNEKMVSYYQGQLDTFANTQSSKAALANELLSRATETGQTYQMVRTENGEWIENTGKVIPKGKQVKFGALNIHKGSVGLVDSIAKESNLISQTAKATLDLVSAYRGLPVQGTDQNQPTATPSVEPVVPTQATEQVSPLTIGEALWSNADNDLPVQIVDATPFAAPDGSSYIKVSYQGRESYVPANELNMANVSAVEDVPVVNQDTPPMPETAPSLEGTELVIDDNGVGRNVPIQAPMSEPTQVEAVEPVAQENTLPITSDSNQTYSISNLDDLVSNGGGVPNVVNSAGEVVPFKNFAVDIDTEDKTASVGYVKKADSSANKGAAIAAYTELGDKLAEQGITLISSGALTASGKKLWDTLVKQGKAIRKRSGYEYGSVATEVTTKAPAKSVVEPVEVPVPAIEEVAPVTEDIPTGKLSVIPQDTVTQKLEKYKPYKGQNLITSSFKQSNKHIESSTPNPLVAVKDFISSIPTNVEEARNTYAKYVESELTPNQLTQLDNFSKFAKAFNKLIESMLPDITGKEAYRDKDFIQYFIQDGKLDENLKTAISLASYTWLTEYGSHYRSTDEELRAIFGLADNVAVPGIAWKHYSTMGMARDQVVESLGKKVVVTLGLSLRKDMPVERMAKLTYSLGMSALLGLEQAGLIEVTGVSRAARLEVLATTYDSQEAFDKFELSEVKKYVKDRSLQNLPNEAASIGNDATSNTSTDQTKEGTLHKPFNERTAAENEVIYDALSNIVTEYVRVPQIIKDGVRVSAIPKVQKILDISKAGTQGILNKVFGVPLTTRDPSLEPAKFSQTSIVRSDRTVPSITAKNINKSNKIPYKLNLDTVNVLRNLFTTNPEGLKKLLGIKDESYLATKHVLERESLRAKYENIWSGLDKALGFINSIDEEATIYLDQIVNRNQRIGYDNNTLNPQTNKLHRSMLTLESARIVIDKTQPFFEDGELTVHGKFLLGLAEGMEGTKLSSLNYRATTVDKVKPEDFIPAFYKYITKPEFVDQVKLVQELLNGNVSEEAINAGSALMESFNTDEYSFSSLVNLALYLTDSNRVEVSQQLSSDGVTNGQILSNLLNGVIASLNDAGEIINPTMLLQGGLIPANQEDINHFLDTKKLGMLDLYETLGSAMLDSWNSVFAGVKGSYLSELHTTINSIERKFGGRSYAKKLATPFVYGAGILKIKMSIAASFISQIYSNLESINALSGEQRTTELGKLNDSIKELVSFYNVAMSPKVNVLPTADSQQAWLEMAVMKYNSLANPVTTELIDLSSFSFGNDQETINSVRSFTFRVMGDTAYTKFAKSNPMNSLQHTANALTFLLTKHNRVARDNIKGFKPVGFNPITEDNLLEFTFDIATYRAINKTIQMTLGTASGQATVKVFGNYIRERDINTAIINSGFEFGKTLLDSALKQELDRIIPTLAKNAKGEIVEGLSQEQLEQITSKLEDSLAIVVTAMGMDSNNPIASGLTAAVQERIYAQDASHEQRIVRKNVNNIVGIKGKVAKTRDITIGTSRVVQVNPGVSTLALQIQALDSAISNKVMALAEEGAINLHDAHLFSLAKFEAGTKSQNQAMFEFTAKYQLQAEITKSMVRPLQALLANYLHSIPKAKLTEGLKDVMFELPKVDKAIPINAKDMHASIQTLIKMSSDVYSKGRFSLVGLGKRAYSNEINKLKIMKQLKVISQYSGANGGYVLTEKDQKYLDSLIAKVDLDQEVLNDQLTVIQETLNELLEVYPEYKDAIESGDSAVLDPVLAESVSDLPLDYPAYEEAGIKLSDFSLDGLTKYLKEVVRGNPIQMELLSVLLPHLKGVSVKLVPIGSPDVVVDKEPNTLAYYDAKANSINIVEAQLSNMSGMTLLHEVIHAATSRRLHIALSKGAPVELKSAASAISAVMNKVKEQLNPQLVKQFANAFSDVHEFVAESLSNPAFQRVLETTSIQYTPQKVTTGWKAVLGFVSRLLGLKNSTGLEATLMFTAQLLSSKINTAQEFDKVLNPSNILIDGVHRAVKAVNGMTSLEVFEELNAGVISDQFNASLTNLMSDVIDPVMQAAKIDNRIPFDGVTPVDVLWQKTLQSDTARFASSSLVVGFDLSDKESYTLESLQVVVDTALDNSVGTSIYAELKRAYDEAKDQIKPSDFFNGDWSAASPSEVAQAEAKWNHIFDIPTTGTKTNPYLSRFISLGLASAEVNDVFGRVLDPTVKDDPNGLFERLTAMLGQVMDWLSGKFSGVKSTDSLDVKLMTLVDKLVDVDLRYRQKTVSKFTQTIGDIWNIGDSISGVQSSMTGKIADLPFLKNNPIQIIRSGSHITKSWALGYLDNITEIIKDMRNQENPNSPLGGLAEVWNELGASDASKRIMERFIRKANQSQKNRKDHIAVTKESLISVFSENGAYLTKEHHSALTYGLLRTDASSIYNKYSQTQFKNLYANPNYLNNEIAKFQNLVLAMQEGNFKLLRSKDLADFMVGDGRHTLQAKNAQVIASGFDGLTTGDLLPISHPDVQVIDQFVSLLAIRYLSAKQKKTIVEVMNKEGQAKTNAIEVLLKTHRNLSEDARNTLFQSNEVSIIKGYVPDITNSHKDFRVSLDTKEVAEELAKYGYQRVGGVPVDPIDPDQNPLAMFISPDSGMQRYVTGGMSLTNIRRKGTEVVNRSSPQEFKQVAGMVNAAVKLMKQIDGRTYDPRQAEPGMIPTFNHDGSIRAFNYEMTNSNRDALLERNNNFGDVLGQYAGTLIDRLETPTHNAEIIQALYSEYKSNFSKQPSAYVAIGIDSPDPKLRQMWRMLPDETKREVVKTFGKNQPIYIRNDLVNMTFGFTKYGVAEAFDKQSDRRNLLESMVVGLFEGLFQDDGRMKAIKGERIIQEVMAVVKDILVIRNLFTLAGNIISNTVFLSAFGVNPVDMVRDSKLALQSGLSYRKTHALLMKARFNLRTGNGDVQKLEQEIIRLEDNLARNPLREFIEAGMLPTIVDDVSLDSDPYTYLSATQEKLAKFTDPIPQGIKDMFNLVTVGQDTPLHQFLTDATQFSDFTSKYVLYKHKMTKGKAKERMSHKEALSFASDVFINYDVPTSKELQYLNDMGLLMFTKFVLRIQKTIFHLMRHHSGNLLVQSAMLSALTDIPTVFDIFLPYHATAPLNPSVLSLPFVLDEPVPVKLMGSML